MRSHLAINSNQEGENGNHAKISKEVKNMKLVSITELAKEKEQETIRSLLIDAAWEDGKVYRFHNTLLSPWYLFNQCMVNKGNGLNHALKFLEGDNDIKMGTPEHHDFGAFLIDIFG